MRAVAAVALLVALLAPAPAPAQESISPDRPDVSTSTTTVPRGAAQVETGVEYARTGRAGVDERELIVEVVLRAGVTDRLEARLQFEPLVRLGGPEDDTGHGDVTLSLKHRFLDARGAAPALGVLPFVKLPAAGAPIGSERPDFGIVGMAGFDLPAGFALDVNAGVAAVGVTRPGGYLAQGLAAVALQRDLIPDRLQGFVEAFFNTREERDGRDRLGADAGVVWKVARWLAVDLAVATTLAGRGPDHAVRSGVSVLLGR